MHDMARTVTSRVTRRQFAVTAGCAIASIGFGQACAVPATSAEGSDGRLSARPRAGVSTSLTSGPLGLGGTRDGVIQMPSAAVHGNVPLLVYLHGASQSGAGMLRRIGPAADRAGIAVLAP